MIRKHGRRFYLYSHEGKLLGVHETLHGAKAQEIAINLSKARAAGYRIPRKPARKPAKRRRR